MLWRENMMLVQNISMGPGVTLPKGSTRTPDGCRGWEQDVEIPLCRLLLCPQKFELIQTYCRLSCLPFVQFVFSFLRRNTY